MSRQELIYRLLEQKMLSYRDYIDVAVKHINEQCVPIPTTLNLAARQIDEDMRPYTGEQVYVRQTVLKKLREASTLLAAYDPSLQLEVAYGYRALEIQKRLFEKHKTELASKYSDDQLLEAVHRLVAVPDVAGHPTGGAVDIQITQGSKPLDFGTKIWEFDPNSYTFSPFINAAGCCNRQLLRRVMIAAGFAPFDGEWWHFSYGDKGWAKYYGIPNAIYQQIKFRTHIKQQ